MRACRCQNSATIAQTTNEGALHSRSDSTDYSIDLSGISIYDFHTPQSQRVAQPPFTTPRLQTMADMVNKTTSSSTGKGAPAGPSRSKGKGFLRLSLIRNSILPSGLFGRHEEDTQTLDEDREDPTNRYAQLEQEILDQLPELAEEDTLPAVPDTLNLSILTRAVDLQEIDGTTWISVAVPNDDASENLDLSSLQTVPATKRCKIDYKDLQRMTAADLREFINNDSHGDLHAEGLHRLLCTIEADFKCSLDQTAALEKANKLNQKKLEDALNKIKDMNNETTIVLAREKSAVEKASRYQGYYKDTDRWLKDAQQRINELEAADDGITQDDVDALNESYGRQIAELKAQLEEAQRGRTHSRNNNGSSDRTESSLAMSRERALRDKGSGSGKQPSEKPEKGKKTNKKTSKKQGSGHLDDSDSSDSDSSNSSHTDSSDSESESESETESVIVTKKAKKSDKGLVHYDKKLTAASKLHTGGKGIAVDKFSNDGKLTHEQWEMQVEQLLDNMSFKDRDSALRHVHGLTSGTVWLSLKTRVPSKLKDTTGKPFSSVFSMLRYIKMNFGIHNEEGKGHNNFFNLKQQDGERFSTFYRKYQTDRAHVHLEAATERQLFLSKLNSEYSEKFITGDKPKKLSAMVKKCQTLEQQFDQHKETHKKTAPRAPAAPRTNGSTAPVSGTTPKSSDDTTPKGKAWDTRPAKYKDLLPHTKENRIKLMKEGACLKCQEKGHLKNSPDCPLKDFVMPKQVAAAAGTVAASDESENAESTA